MEDQGTFAWKRGSEGAREGDGSRSPALRAGPRGSAKRSRVAAGFARTGLRRSLGSGNNAKDPHLASIILSEFYFWMRNDMDIVDIAD